MEWVAACCVAVAYIIWLLWLPAWPSQDGPVHLYYTQVLGALLTHSDPVYSHYFAIRHILPPYSLYYYGLLGLSHVFPLLLADRIVICGYVLSFVLGFRYLARALGPAADTVTLLATPLILSWSLGMGFVNYCLSLSFAFWAIGLWLRMDDRTRGQEFDLRRRVSFVALAIVIMLTHPVPLAIVIVVCGIMLVADAYRTRWRTAILRDIVTLGAASLTLVYVKLFTTSHPLEQVEPEQGSFLTQVAHRILRYGREDGVALVFGHHAAIYIYRAAVGLLLVIPIVVAIQQCVKDRARSVWTRADTMLVLGLLLFVLLPLIPSQVNGLFYFADRLPLLVWLTLLLSASGATALAAPKPAARVLIVGFAILANAALLYAAEVVLHPVAASIAAIDRTPRTLEGQLGFILEDPRPPASVTDEPSWNPYYWSAIHVFRHNHAVLANAPWMSETILPVGATAALPENEIPALRTPQPSHVDEELGDSTKDLQDTLHATSFFVMTQHGRPEDLSAADALLAKDPSSKTQWQCHLGVAEWYSVCEKTIEAPGR